MHRTRVVRVRCRDRKRTEPSRIITVRFGSIRTEPNSNQIFRNAVEPNRTRTGSPKMKPNRTESELILEK